MTMSPEVRERLEIVYDVVKTTFHWSFVPIVLYLGKPKVAPDSMCFYSHARHVCLKNVTNEFFKGFKKGAEPGMPPLSLMSLLWQ